MTVDKEKLNILSLNVRGLKDGKKRREIFRWLKNFHRGGSSVVFLQETHSEPATEKVWDRDWGSKIYFSHGSARSCGVAILLPMKYNFTITNVWSDKEGRIVSITADMGNESISFVNVYTPTKDKQINQKSFWTNLVQNVDLDEHPTVIGGDFNTYLNVKGTT